MVPSAAALKARIVSRGRSIRLRVGLDRSGSARDMVSVNICYAAAKFGLELTDEVSLVVFVHYRSQVLNRGLLLCLFRWKSKSVYGQQHSLEEGPPGVASFRALEGSAFVFSLFLSLTLSVNSSLWPEKELLRRVRCEVWLIVVCALGRPSCGWGEIGGDMVVMVSIVSIE